MNTEAQGDTMEKETPADSPSVEQPTSSESNVPQQGTSAAEGDTSVDRGSDEPMIPKSRFDEALAKERAKREEDMLSLKRDMESKLHAAATSLTGEQQGELPDKDILELSTKYGVDTAFLKDMETIYAKRAEARIAETLKPLQSQQQQVAYDREFNQLIDEFPEAAQMTSEEKEEFKKLAHQPAYTKTRLTDLWKIQNYDKPKGQRKTVESGRGRGTGFSSDELDISSMSDEEFLAYGNKLANKN